MRDSQGEPKREDRLCKMPKGPSLIEESQAAQKRRSQVANSDRVRKCRLKNDCWGPDAASG